MLGSSSSSSHRAGVLFTGQRPTTAAADPERFFSTPSTGAISNLKASISRPKTSHDPVHTFDPPETPRIPLSYNRTPPITSLESLAADSMQPPSPPPPIPSHGLSSYSSFSSLRSQGSDSSPRKRRKRILPFKNKFIGAWHEAISKSDSNLDRSALNRAGNNTSSERIHVSQVTEQLAELPADLRPAAAKRLGIGISNAKVSSSLPPVSAMRTGPSSIVHSRVGSNSDRPPKTASTPRLDSLPSTRGHASHISPANSRPRPEHTLQTEARTIGEQSMTSVPEHTVSTTFFDSGSSDSEDDDQYSSGYSCGSSHTSYNVNMSPDLDKRQREAQNEWSAVDNAKFRKDVAAASSLHQSQRSTSSFSSSQAAATTSAPRSFPRFTSHAGMTHGPSSNSASRDNDGELQAPLAAIREDSPLPTTKAVIMPTASRSLLKSSSYGLNLETGEKPSLVSRNAGQPYSQNRIFSPRHQRIPEADSRSARPLSLAVMKQSEALISSDSAEAVILHVFETIDNFKDLFACARLNRGFYRVFKLHELRLMKNTLRNMSPAQWEHREASPKEIIASVDASKPDYTPTRYVQFHKRDSFVLMALKSVILARCQAFLRYDTVNALAERDSPRSTRVDDALWRIWTFCTIFGSDKGREHDVHAQMDWLRGGVEAHRPTSPLSVATSRHARSSSTMTRISESFGRGNYGGLTLDELYDITEMWNCIKSLLQGILGPGRRAQAREHGVFDGHNIDGDADAEGAMLEEWVCYLSTLGLSTVVDLATHSNSSTNEVFSTAKYMDWTCWRMPDHGMSRSGFLQEPVTRMYEEKTNKTTQVSVEQMRAKRKSRGHELAAELREEKTRHIKSKDPIAQHPDQSINLWLEWMAKVDRAGAGVQEETLAAKEADRATEKRETSTTDKKESNVADNFPLPPPRARRSNSSLSLFPSAYKKPTPNPTPRMSPMSTPLRSRNNSRTDLVLQPAAARQELGYATKQQQPQQPDQNHLEQKQPLFTPRLSICQET